MLDAAAQPLLRAAATGVEVGQALGAAPAALPQAHMAKQSATEVKKE